MRSKNSRTVKPQLVYINVPLYINVSLKRSRFRFTLTSFSMFSRKEVLMKFSLKEKLLVRFFLTNQLPTTPPQPTPPPPPPRKKIQRKIPIMIAYEVQSSKEKCFFGSSRTFSFATKFSLSEFCNESLTMSRESRQEIGIKVKQSRAWWQRAAYKLATVVSYRMLKTSAFIPISNSIFNYAVVYNYKLYV